jgi:hypothetical protein
MTDARAGRVELTNERGEAFAFQSLGKLDDVRVSGGVTPLHGTADDGRRVFAKAVRTCPLAAYDVDDLGRAVREAGFLRLWDVAESPHILPLTFAGYGLSGHVRVYPFADGGSLAEQLHARTFPDPQDARDKITAALDGALATLHHLRIAHCDVAPNNLVCVAGVWLLADLDHATAFGKPITGRPCAPYCMPDRKIGSPAAADVDLYGRDQVLARLDRYISERDEHNASAP